jgi:hypothetical protein
MQCVEDGDMAYVGLAEARASSSFQTQSTVSSSFSFQRFPFNIEHNSRLHSTSEKISSQVKNSTAATFAPSILHTYSVQPRFVSLSEDSREHLVLQLFF